MSHNRDTWVETPLPKEPLCECGALRHDGQSEYYNQFTLIERLQHVNGCDLEWHGLWEDSSLEWDILVLRAAIAPERFVRLSFMPNPEFALPTSMHNVRMRLPLPEDISRRRESLKEHYPELPNPPSVQRWADAASLGLLVVVNSDEGEFWASAMRMEICVTGDLNVDLRLNTKQMEHDYDLDAPLWDGGPPISML